MARVFKRGNKWYVDYRLNGRRVWKSVGTSKRLAEDYLKDIEAKLVRGELMSLNEVKPINFDDFANLYLKRYGPNKAESTRARDEVIVEKHLIRFFGRRPLKRISTEDIEEFKAARSTTRLKNGSQIQKSTVNRELDLFKSLLARAVDWGYLNTNAADKVRKFKLEEKEPRFLTPEQVAALMKTATGQMKGFITVGLNTGLRKQELFDLKWEDVDFSRQELRVRKSKGKRFRVIPINAVLLQILKSHPRHIRSPYVFHNPDGSQWHDVRKGFEKALEIARLPRIRIHDMRHSFLSNLFMAGVDARAIQVLAGHRDIRTTMRYAHLAPGHLKDSVEKLQWIAQGSKEKQSVSS